MSGGSASWPPSPSELGRPSSVPAGSNFPEVDAVLDPHTVDRSVEYVHIRRWRPDLVANTPDWLIYFEAELDGFAGIGTKDRRQSIQGEEAFALTHTKLAVVTWREPPHDPVVEWAMVIAYMPEIKRILHGRHDPPFVFLPSPPPGEHTHTGAAPGRGARNPGRRAGDIERTNRPAARLRRASLNT